MARLLRVASRLVRSLAWGERRRRRIRDRAILAESDLLDAAWYCRTYPEVPAAGWDPIDHFLAYGAAGRLSPGPNFDAPSYLAANPDVAADGLNPLIHYIEHGRRERRPLTPPSTAREQRRD